MKFKCTTKKVTSVLLALSLVLSLTACGTLIYPERRGQTAGRIDPGVAILDGVGLVVFIIPGLVAFGVDFTTGAIYLPRGKKTARKEGELKVVHFKPEERSPEKLGKIISKETGEAVDLASEDLQAYVVEPARDAADSLREMAAVEASAN